VDIRASMRQLDSDRWIASTEGEVPLHADGASREECLERIRHAAAERAGPSEPVTLIVEVVPLLAGVAETASVMGWDKRRVITYIDRGRFPEPIQSLASGRIWVRSDVERFAEQWRARQLGRRRRGRGHQADAPPPQTDG
jgi:hypothetical protein